VDETLIAVTDIVGTLVVVVNRHSVVVEVSSLFDAKVASVVVAGGPGAGDADNWLSDADAGLTFVHAGARITVVTEDPP